MLKSTLYQIFAIPTNGEKTNRFFEQPTHRGFINEKTTKNNMNRRIFNQCIAKSNFKELFISEMGWNNPHGQTEFELELGETAYVFQIIAERNGFQVLTCEVLDIPTASLCKKMDTRLRRAANDYICVFYLPDSQHHLWAVPVKKVEKRDIVLVEYTQAESAGFLFEKMEGLSFDLNERTTITDVVGKVQSAFIINSERITKDFYTGFKKEHTKFAQFITGIDDHIEVKDNRNKQWYTSVMLNRLMFCYFIQKKGFLNGDVDYLRHKLERHLGSEGTQNFASLHNALQHTTFFQSFYKGFLISLFHDGLNTPRHGSSFEGTYGRIPYLNGGMFDFHQLEQDYKDLDISDEAFISLFDFFDKWHWHLDDRITASGRDINPDVLGYIFEQYINDRAQMGAYYTKEDITEYIGRNTIVPYLLDAAIGDHASERDTVGANNDSPSPSLWQFLRDSGDRYIFDAVKKGAGLEIPEEIAIGIDATQPNLLERRKHWNERTPERFALPTEIWRETIERLQRYERVKAKIENGEITQVNDFITYNLDIRSFVYDLLNYTDDAQLIEQFYAELQKITILDPTCGSGAFLFAALNILEPFYEVCIMRMQEFHAKDKELFSRQLDEIQNKYRSNIQYFIYKSIILRNLYGVDIMVEATEIAKLRLFLKMVAVVDVDRRDPNMGLDPLPDIDFNICCGNTLVGYANEKALDDDLNYGDPFAAAELRPQIQKQLGEVAEAYRKFKALQLMQTEEPDAFKRVKGWLKEHLNALNDLLNRKLYQSTTIEEKMSYERWLRTHQPFHWLAEFYEIINDHGGFDVVIGNPPYVEYSKVRDTYKILSYKTESCGNLYAYIIERSMMISRNDMIGMIVPTSSISTVRMKPLQTLLTAHGLTHSTFGFRPAKLFDGGTSANIHLSIVLCNGKKDTSSMHHIKWNALFRKYLFLTLPIYVTETSALCKIYKKLLRIKSPVEYSVLFKMASYKPVCSQFSLSSNYVYYRSTGGLHYRVFSLFPTYSKKETVVGFRKKEDSLIMFAIYASNLWNMFYYSVANCLDVAQYEISYFPIGLEEMKQEIKDKLISLSEILDIDIKNKSEISIRHYINVGDVECYQFNMKLSKPIIDEIDKVLAKHYGFTEEELDFIINYDIKYRMGDELES